MATVVLAGSSRLLAPYHEWLADARDSLHLLAPPVRAVRGGRLEDALGRFASVHVYDGYETNVAVERDVLELAERIGVTAVVAVSEADLVRAGDLRDHLGLGGAGRSSAVAFGDRVLTRTMLCESGVPVPAFRAVDSILDLVDLVAEHGYPVLLRPRLAGGRKDARLIRGPSDLERLAEEGLAPGVEWLPHLIAEPWLEGDRFQVDGLVLDGSLRFCWPTRWLELAGPTLAGRRLEGVMVGPDDPLRTRLQELAARALGALPTPQATAFQVRVLRLGDGRLLVDGVSGCTAGRHVSDMVRQVFGVDVERACARHQAGLDPQVAMVDPVRRVRSAGLGGFVDLPVGAGHPEDPDSAIVEVASLVAVGRDPREVHSRLRDLDRKSWSEARMVDEEGAGPGCPS